MTASLVAHVLADLVADYFRSARSTDRDTRVVVPGLTAAISEELHSALLASGIPSYLVVPRDGASPDRARHWIYAEGLTSKREGSFVGVSHPGQLSRIQESVLGSGGACLHFPMSGRGSMMAWPASSSMAHF